jgi:uncharacterized protein (TIGR02145 family)/uncharacterized repeat protein (TIGR02543 family)
MKKSSVYLLASSIFLIFTLFYVRCVNFESPNAPEKTKISAIFKASSSKIYETSLVDSVGKEVWFGAALYLPVNFDSLQMSVLDNGNTIIDTCIRTFKSDYYYDTIWLKHTFLSPGTKNLTITPFSVPERAAITTTITIQGTLQNASPKWSVDTLRKTIRIGTPILLSLSEMCTDAENELITYTLVPSAPENDTIVGTAYQFNPTLQTVGTYVAQIKASDPNGNTSILPIKISVDTTIEDKIAPEVSMVSPTDTNVTIITDSFTIDLLCSDRSGIASVYAVMGTTTFQSNLKNGHYTIKINGFTKGQINIVSVKAKDSSSAANTASRNLYFNYQTSFAGYTVTYLKGTGVTGNSPVDTKKYQNSEQVIVSGNTGNLIKSGFTFSGWNTKEDGSGTSYAGGSTLLMGSADVVLYAQFTTCPTSKIVYNGNGNTGGTVPADSNNYIVASTVTVKENSGLLSKTGATFAGWNTAPDGSGTAYAVGATFSMGSSNITLYARWKQQSTFTITYNGNTNTAGAAPVDPANYEPGTAVTVKGNTGNMVKASYTFTGWNTASDGSGIIYIPGSTFKIETDVTLYARWTQQQTLTITYNGNGNTSGTAPVDPNLYENGMTATVKDNTGNMVKTGSTFTGWNTAADGSGTAYAAGATFPMGSATITLYAVWTTKPTFTVTYNGNTNTDGTVPADANKYENGATVTVKDNTGLLVKTGSTFTGWNTAADGSGTAYAAGTTIPMDSANITLYAVWTTKPTFTVTYNGNTNTGGIVPADANKYETGATVTVKDNSGLLVKTGSTFTGWNTAANGSGTAYAAGATFLMGSANITLYAVWTTKPTFTVTYNGNTNTDGTVPADANKYENGATVTVKDNTGLLVKIGSTFTGWNTSADGSGTAYAAGTTFPMGSANITLYAVWTAKPTFTVTYNGNGNSNGTVPSDISTYETAATVTVKSNSGLLVRTGFIFNGWNTAADASGISYAVGTTFPMGSANITLYAQWKSYTYTVTFDGQTVVSNSTKEVTSPKTTVETLPSPTAAGYQFGGWYTGIYGGGSSFLATTVVTENIIVYAKWTRVYKVTYNVNTGGGTVPVDANAYKSGDFATVLSGSSLSKQYYTFAGWNTQPDTLGTNHSSGGTFTIGSADVILYAKWRMNLPSITTQLSNKTCPVNDSVTFSVAAIGASLSYAWHLNNAPIPGATGSSYTTSKLTKNELSTSRAYKCVVTNPAGSVNSSCTLSVSTFSDVDGNVYHEVKLAGKTWMMENLKTTKYNDGSLIQNLNQGETWLYAAIGHYCWREDNIADKKYGALYNWPAVQTGKLPPVGWRLPTEAEWTALFNAYDICELRTEGIEEGGYNWDGCSSYSSASYCGFNAMALGFIDAAGLIHSLGGGGWWWITEEKQAVNLFGDMGTKVHEIVNYGTVGCGVRCVK